MEITDVTTHLIDDLEVDILISAGRLQRMLHGLGGATNETAPKVYDDMLSAVEECVVDVRGLTEHGKPLKWKKSVIKLLPKEIVAKLFGVLADPGGTRQVGDPLAAGTPSP